MATIVGGNATSFFPDQVLAAVGADTIENVLARGLERLSRHSEAGVLALSHAGSNFVEYFLQAQSNEVQTLVVIATEGNSITTRVELVTTSELQGMQGVTSHGNGVFSIVRSTLTSGSSSALTADEGFSVHGLTDADTSGVGLDSLVGGGAAVSDAQASFLISAAEESGASAATLADIAHNLKLISKAGTTAASDLAVDVVGLVLADDASYDQIELEYGKNTLVMANLEDMGNTTLVLTGMQKALVTGSGTVRLGDGAEGSLLVGDSTNQVLISGTGSDTLVGGGGTDTLVGGAGADVFGFNSLGHYTITDFVAGVDKAYFEFGGINSIDDIRAYLTGVTEVDGNTTFHFGPNASITLIGVSADAAIGPLLFDI